MRKQFVLCFVLLGLIAGGCGDSKVVEKTVKRGNGEQDVAMVKADNTKMNAAMAEARRTVPQFITKIQAAKPGQGYTIKVRVTDGVKTEYMWLRDLSYDGAAFHGALMDNPYEVKGYKEGQAMTVKPSEIADWMIVTQTGREGGFTEKVIEESSTTK